MNPPFRPALFIACATLLMHPLGANGEVIYFVLTDRFEDGDSGNNYGGRAPQEGRNVHGFDPLSTDHYHGGDFAGLVDRLDYLQGLGVTALWLTPPFRNQAVQFGTAGYHGYWILDFLDVDPHLGQMGDFTALVNAVQARGMKIYLDIVANHTADVISYQEDAYDYISKSDSPYRDASGGVFDDRNFAWNGTGPAVFPELSTLLSFPYTPEINSGLSHAKNPSWLNDARYYHNRGNSTFAGESSLYGDFVGLDDLFTENPLVVQGLIDVYRTWIEERGIDGFRIDTVKHVNLEFWQAFAPAMRAAAKEMERGHFHFGEVLDGDPALLSEFTTSGRLDAVLDFPLAFALREFVSKGGSSAALAALFTNDDYYSDGDSSALDLPTFLGNHDIGRWSYFLREDNPQANDGRLQQLFTLGYAALFLLRGQPVIYYGDEQGFVGGGTDALAREPMLPARAAAYTSMNLIGTSARPSAANFDTDHPLYQALAELAQLRRDHPTLRRGFQVTRATGNEAVFAASRFDPGQNREYLALLNRHRDAAQTVTIPTWSGEGTTFSRIYASSGQGSSGAQVKAAGEVSITLSPLQAVLFLAGTAPPAPPSPPKASFSGIAEGSVLPALSYSAKGHTFPYRAEVVADVSGSGWAAVDFAYARSDAPMTWQSLGTDYAPPYRTYLRVPRDLDAAVTFSLRAVARNAAGSGPPAIVRELRLAPELSLDHLLVHYHRSDADYSSWRLHAEGAGIPGGNATAAFTGEDAFGRFAWVKLDDPTQPVRIDVRAPGNMSQFGGWHQVTPISFPRVWAAAGTRTIHDSPAGAIGLLSIETDLGYEAGMEVEIARSDASGAYQTFATAQALEEGGAARFEVPLFPRQVIASARLRVVRGGSVLFERLGGDLRRAPVLHLREGFAGVLYSEVGTQGLARLHYHRSSGDYGNAFSSNFEDYWGLHVWTGAQSPTEDWEAPIKPTAANAFGLVFDIPLQGGATELAYIIHRGNEKDPGPDQSLPLEAVGYEAWQVQGADPAHPYLLTAGGRNPSRKAIVPAAPSMSLTNGRLEVRWVGTPNLVNQLRRSESLVNWADLGSQVNGLGQTLDHSESAAGSAFFLVEGR